MSTPLRRYLLVLVLIAVAWVWAVPGEQQLAVKGLAHELVHLQFVSHHHHKDAALYLDDAAPAEASHHHASDGAKPMAWSVLEVRDLGALPRHVFVTTDQPHSVAVVLEGPLRPPSVPRA
jgi:hypothetical protein